MSYYPRKKSSAKQPTPTFPMLDVLTLACAAYRINGNQLYTTALVDDPKVPNGAIIKNHLQGAQQIPFTDSDRETAETVLSYINNQTVFNLLAGKPTGSFFKTVNDRISQETAFAYDAGLIAYAPKLYFDALALQAKKDEYSTLTSSDEPIGTFGSKVEIDFTMTSKRYLQQFNSFIVNGHDGKGHGISFFTNFEDRCVSGRITGKIKSFQQDKYNNNAWMTTLNFVKVK